MNLFKWKKEFKPKFPNIIEKFFGKKISDNATSSEDVATIPSVNISDVDKAFEVSVAVPGLDKKDIKIEVRDNCLVVSSEKQYENEEKRKNWVRKEYGYAAFQRIFELPPSADPDKINAAMDKGVLNIKIAKKKGYMEKKKQIEIT